MQKEIQKALTLCGYAFEYLDCKPTSTTAANKTDVPAALLIMFLREDEKLETNPENFFLSDRIWSFIFAPPGKIHKCSNIDIITKFFVNFVLKCCCSGSIEFCRRCDELSCNLVELISEFDHCSTYVDELNVYRNMVLISTEDTDSASFCEAVSAATCQLKSLIRSSSSNLDRVAYLATSISMKLRYFSLNQYPTDKHRILEICELFLILAERISNGLQDTSKENEKSKKEIAAVVWLCSFILGLIQRATDQDLNDPEIFTCVKKAFKLGSTYMADCKYLEEKKKMSSYYSIGMNSAFKDF